MKWIKNLGICILVLCGVDSCVKEPSFSIVPSIESLDIYFKKGNASVQDTLTFKLRFTDGDGDLGSTGDTTDIYNRNPWYWAYSPTTFNTFFTTSTKIKLPDSLKWIDYQARKLSQFSNLPGINCDNWVLLYSSDGSPAPHVIDTIYVTQNLRAFNISVDVYEKVNGTYQLYNPETNSPFPGCNPNLFRATFPNLSNDQKKSPLEGVITFRLHSYQYYNLFGSKTLKMSVTISDRAYNVSQPATKEDFTLQSIAR